MYIHRLWGGSNLAQIRLTDEWQEYDVELENAKDEFQIPQILFAPDLSGDAEKVDFSIANIRVVAAE